MLGERKKVIQRCWISGVWLSVPVPVGVLVCLAPDTDSGTENQVDDSAEGEIRLRSLSLRLPVRAKRKEIQVEM